MPNDWHYAVVVGIDDYPGVSNLAFPRHDAAAFEEWLRSPQGGDVPEDNIKPVMLAMDAPAAGDWLDAKPTAEELDKALVRVNVAYQQRLENDPDGWDASRLYIYASGHGITTAQGLGSVLFAGAAPDQGYWDHAEIGEYKTWYITAKLFKEVLIFSDCCRERRPSVPPMRPKLEELMDYGNAAKVWVMFGAELGERAYEPDPAAVNDKRGFFTRALLEGLNGGAIDQDGKITATGLFNYVQKAVIAVTKGTPYPQEPDQDGNPDIVIRERGEALPKVTRNVRLVFPAGSTGRVRLWLRGEQLGDWDTAQGPWSITLPEDFEYVAAALDGQPPLKGGGAFRVVGKDGDVVF